MQFEANIERNLGPIVRDGGAEPSPGFWSYVDVYDLAEMLRLAAESDLDGHEVFYAAQPDNAAGKHVRCPSCKQAFAVPAAPALPAESAWESAFRRVQGGSREDRILARVDQALEFLARQETNGEMCDVVVDVSGNPNAILKSVDCLHRQSTMVLGGLTGDSTVTPMLMDKLVWNEIPVRELNS